MEVFGHLHQELVDLVEHRGDQFLAGRKIEEHRGHRDARLFGDLCVARGAQPAARKDPHRALQQLGAAFRLVQAAGARTAGGTMMRLFFHTDRSCYKPWNSAQTLDSTSLAIFSSPRVMPSAS